MRFRIIVLLLLAAFAIGMTACGGGDETSPTPETVEGTVEDGGTTTEEGGGGGGQGDAAAGEEVFAQGGCGTCHVLDAAGTSGTIGPNLDESKPSFELVVDRVTNGSGAMPSFKDQFSEEQIQNVAAYVVESTQ